MKLRAKLAILTIAIFLTFLGFNLIASSSVVDVLKIGKKAGYKIIANTLNTSLVHGQEALPNMEKLGKLSKPQNQL
jgi:hypothetical protein